MTLYFDPFRELDQLTQQIISGGRSPRSCPMDAYRRGDTVFVHFDVPGVEPSSIDIGVEQNALTSFRSRTTLVPAFANTIGPALFLAAERIIGGADGAFNRGMQWQGLSLRMTLRHEPTPWIPSTYMPTLAGRLFYLQELAEPLVAECN